MNFVTFSFNLGLLAIILSAVPFVTRQSECFGVNVGTKLSYSNQLLRWKRQYLLLMGSFAAVFFLFAWIIPWFLGILIFYLVFSFGLYLIYHFRTKSWKKKQIANGNLKEQATVIVEASGDKEESILPSWYYFVLFFLFLLTLFLTFMLYKQAPAKFPAYWKLNGVFEIEKDKTPVSASIWPASQFFTILTFLGIHLTIRKSKRIIDLDDPDISLERMKRANALYSRFMFGISLLMVSFFGFLQCSFLLNWSWTTVRVGSILLWLFLLIAFFWLTFFVGQGGSRLKVMGIRRERKMVQKDDHYWKLGIFYFNRLDPALFIEKRFGIGWTVNLARPIIWLILLIVLVLVGIKQFFFS